MNDEKELPFSKESTYESKDNRKNPRKWENKRKQINDKGLRIGGWLIPHKKTIGGFFSLLFYVLYHKKCNGHGYEQRKSTRCTTFNLYISWMGSVQCTRCIDAQSCNLSLDLNFYIFYLLVLHIFLSLNHCQIEVLLNFVFIDGPYSICGLGN
jgi:hypothetical protein